MTKQKFWDGLPISIILAIVFGVLAAVTLLLLRKYPDLWNWLWFFAGAAAGCAAVPAVEKVLRK